MLRRLLKFLSFLCTIYLILNINLGFASRLSIVRDTEIESIIVNYVTPVFRAARLDPDSIQIFIVKDDSLNAFVMNGQKIFIHSGLLIESESAEEIIGVIAHETGHIAGGHLSRRRNALSNFSMSNFLSFALAGAATIATKRSDVGTALVGVGQTIGQRSFFSYNRAQESAADYAAVRFLEKARISALGLLNFMVRIREQESMNSNRENRYTRTHPFSDERISSLKNYINEAFVSDNYKSKDTISSHARLKAKITSFLTPPRRTIRFLEAKEKSLAVRYGLAIAYHRLSKYELSQKIIDNLIKDFPSDPYFLELKGQFLFEVGRGKEALSFLNKAVDILPDAPLLRQLTARVQIELNEPKLVNSAIKHLKIALTKEPGSKTSWQQLAIAYGRLGDQRNSWLAMAEKELLSGSLNNAMYQASRAEKSFPTGSKEWLQAKDILNAVKIKKSKKKYSKPQN